MQRLPERYQRRIGCQNWLRGFGPPGGLPDHERPIAFPLVDERIAVGAQLPVPLGAAGGQHGFQGLLPGHSVTVAVPSSVRHGPDGGLIVAENDGGQETTAQPTLPQLVPLRSMITKPD